MKANPDSSNGGVPAGPRAAFRGGTILLDAASILPTIFLFFVLGRRLVYSPVSYDEEQFIRDGWAITNGLIPYRDFYDCKPPVLFLTNALALLFGLDEQRYRLFFGALSLTSLIAVQCSLLRNRVSRLLSVATSGLFVGLFLDPSYHDTSLNDAESVGLTYYCLALALGLWPHGPAWPTRLRLAASGFFFACCVMSKEPFAPCVAATVLALVLLRFRPGGGEAYPHLAWTSIGATAFAVLLALYLVPTGGMTHYIHTLGIYRSFGDPTENMCVKIGRWTPTTTWADTWAQHWGHLRTEFVNFDNLAVVVPFLLLTPIFGARRAPGVVIASTAALVAAMIAVTATGCYWMHYYIMAYAGLFCVVALGLVLMARDFSSLPRWLSGVIGVFAMTLTSISVAGPMKSEWGKTYTPQPLRANADLIRIVEENAAPHDYIFTTGPPAIYVLTDRHSPLRQGEILDEYIFTYPGATDGERFAELRARLDRHLPKVVFLDPYLAERRPRHLTGLILPFLADHPYRRVSPNIFVLSP